VSLANISVKIHELRERVTSLTAEVRKNAG